MYLHGYCVQERLDRLEILKKVKTSFRITSIRPNLINNNQISARLPICYEGATPPRPSQGDLLSSISGVAHRVASETPQANRRLMREFKRYVSLWLRRNISPLSADKILNFDEWLEGTTYSEGRRQELRRVWSSCDSRPKPSKLRQVKCFIKDEPYVCYKMPRGIFSRADAAKCLYGPVVQSISNELFKLDWFIKKVPVKDRPMAIYDKLYKTGSTYCFTDYTAYEAHFKRDLMNCCENLLFRYMTKRLDAQTRGVVQSMITTKTGTNKIIFKVFSCNIEACRMSGEMDTSLSNGFTNLMLYLFTSFKAGCPDSCIKGFVEGDDGLFRNDGPFASTELFEQMGMSIKIGLTDKLEHASFCGQVYSIEDLSVVTDVKEQVCRLGWTTKNYVNATEKTKMELLRARGYSLVYQYGGCPILGILGKRILELTHGITIRSSILDRMDAWDKSRMIEAMQWQGQVKPPGISTRQLVEELYHIPISEQLDIEGRIETMGLGGLPFQFSSVPESWTHFWNTYGSSVLGEQAVWLPQRAARLLQQLDRVGALTGAQHLDFFGGRGRV